MINSFYRLLISNNINRNLIFLIILLFTNYVQAVEPIWSVDFASIFDNREGDAKITGDKTYMIVSLSPEIGMAFSKKDFIAGGVVWNQPIENGIKDGKLSPTLYYRHTEDKWKFSMGLFPRSQLREPLPGFIWCDSLTYYQRNIRGFMVQYEDKDKGFFDFYLDWRAIQSSSRREAFNIVFQGEKYFVKRLILYGGIAQMNHFAKTKAPNDSQNIVDDFLINPYFGINMKNVTFFDEFTIKTGLLAALERHRGVSNWKSPVGFWCETLVEWKIIGVRNSLYAGSPLFPLYGEYGNLLYQGEAYYSSSFYDRLDLYVRIFGNKFLDLQAQLNFNIAKESFMFYQRLILNINLNSRKEKISWK